MSIDVKEQVLTEIKSSPLFSFQLDESTDVSSCSQLLVFVRYINSGDIKDEFLFCSALETTTKADDVMEKNSTSKKIFNGKTCAGFVLMGHQLCWDRNQDSSLELRSWHLKQRASTA